MTICKVGTETDMTKLIVGVRKFTNAPDNKRVALFEPYCVCG